MKILHVIPSLHPVSGGPPAIAARLAAGQVGLGHDVTILCYDYGASAAELHAAYGRVPNFERVRQVRLPRPGRWERLRAAAASDALRGLLAGDRPDVMHLHAVWERILVAAARAARRAEIPYLVLVNGMLDPWSLSQRRWKKRIALAVGTRAMLDGAAALHLGNDDERELIRPLGLRPRPVVIPNGVTPEEFTPLPSPGTFRRRWPALADAPFVLFLSRLHYKKGLDLLGEAFAAIAARLPEVHLVVAGPDDGARAPFEAAMAAAGLARRVHLTGALYGVDKWAALADATCFCLPSRQEGFSVAVLEALACGVPAVITTGCHFPEVARSGAGRVAPPRAAEVAEALAGVLSDPAGRAAMAAAGMALVASRYTWKAVATQSVDAYHQASGRITP